MSGITPERWSRIKTLFAAAADLRGADRDAYLARECAGDEALAQELRSLLASHDEGGDFLAPVPDDLRATALGSGLTPGERLGPYRLLEKIGTGGMGDVYKAVRDDDQYRAEVAIKLLRGELRDTHSERRFKAERQILATLDHRNIARLLDGGTTPAGLPYVVMELVAGEPIDRYCDARELDTRERVRLFLQVCAAVGYAHQHLVVHRDLKPNNIFVTADGSVKLLDFGIAKVLDPEPVTGTPPEDTRTLLRAMTLEYASPEQVSGGTVTTASDVYSLGVVLYRLLTGQSPYRASGGEAARVAEILGDTSPTRPSAVPTQDRRGIEADLDHILLKALRKEPAKRYGSVEQLAADLRNYLEGRPVGARRGTLAYRSAKYVRRNKAPIAGASLAIVSLIAGLGLAIREARIANAERATAERHFNSVRQLANRLFDFHDAIAELQGATKAREMLVKTSMEYLGALYAEQGNDLSLKRELADAYRRLAAVQGSPFDGNTGDTNGALVSYRRAAELAEELRAATPDDHRVTRMLADIYTRTTYLLAYKEASSTTLEPARRAVLYADAAAPFVEEPGALTELLVNAYWASALAQSITGNRKEAVRMADRMVAVAEKHALAGPENEHMLERLGVAYSNAGIVLDDSLSPEKGIERAVGLLLKAITVEEKLVQLDPTEVARQWSLAESRLNLAQTYITVGQHRKALDQLDQAAVALRSRAADGVDARAQLVHLMAESFRGWCQFNLGSVDDGGSRLRRVVDDLEALTVAYDSIQARWMLATSRVWLGALLASRAETGSGPADRRSTWREARALLQGGVAGLEEISKSLPLDWKDRKELDLGKSLLQRAEAELR